MMMNSVPDSYEAIAAHIQNTERGQREKHQAADLEVAQVGAMADPDVEAGGEADQDGDRNVDIRQIDGAIAIEKQRVTSRLARHARRHGQKQVGEDRERPAELFPVQPSTRSARLNTGHRFTQIPMIRLDPYGKIPSSPPCLNDRH